MSNKVWYLEALNIHTNEIIANELGAEMAQHGILCQDGVKRDLWECEYRTIAKFLRNEQQGQLHFIVFYRERRYGPVKVWPFAKKKTTLADVLQSGAVKKAVAL